MKAFQNITSPILPIPIKDVDTDLLIPAQFLTRVSNAGYGDCLFRRLRDQDPAFPMNLPKYQSAKVLVSTWNFGCGSSREHAVWALRDAGFQVVIAKSFADIFFANAANNGLLLVQAPEDFVDDILNAASQSEEAPQLTVDLESQTTTWNDRSFSFSYDPFRKHCLLNGLDPLDYILTYQEKLEERKQLKQTTRFFSTLQPNYSL